ncbi:hypothetical protein DdX_14603 [Ditylenchus destructor]|uniref:Uncharacterized protein n=1 Tax=Ditylenchus destructor TaxID=166010 RepID=A0AAD4MWG8_9BILA|nr:hypothetical protein DdX_14603 [Ditylenchus destructor]
MRFLSILVFVLIIALTILPPAKPRKTRRPRLDVTSERATAEDGGDESEERKLLRKSCKYHHQCPRGQQCLSGFCTQRG